MRVTKLIREYVEKSVKKAIPKSEAELRWEVKSKRLNDALTKASEKIEAYQKQVIAEINREYGFSEEGYCLAETNYSLVHSSNMFDDEDYQASKNAANDRRQKIAETIEEILVSLELGGTRVELEEMLAKIGE